MSGAPDDARRAATSAVMDSTIALVRLLGSIRAQKHRSARMLLFPLGQSGPLRQSALADLSHIDQSTISRHVADLVAEGLVERLPDPADGRASLLAMTDDGAAALAQMRRWREDRTSSALAGWTTAEITAFTAALQRYTHDLEGLLAEPPHPAQPQHQHQPQEQ